MQYSELAGKFSEITGKKFSLAGIEVSKGGIGLSLRGLTMSQLGIEVTADEDGLRLSRMRLLFRGRELSKHGMRMSFYGNEIMLCKNSLS